MAYTTIKKPSDYFNTKLYTGNGGTQSITGVGFQPDWVWLKDRTSAYNHVVFDKVRGVEKRIFPNLTNAEDTAADTLTAFNSDGFAIGSNVGINTNTNNYVSWNWLANGAGSANTDGSISSTVSASTTSGFSIVSWTGTGSAATVGHGLGSVPKMMIIKNRDSVEEWGVYHVANGNTHVQYLNTTGVKSDDAGFWNDTTPTSSVFTVGNSTRVNQNGSAMIAYCFAEKQGFSKFGSYTGNGGGAANGNFIYTGFSPAFVMIKNTTHAYNWVIQDNQRNTFNPLDRYIYPNTSDAEAQNSIYDLDLLSNGFKVRSQRSETNDTNNGYIYMAFAEQPLVGDNPDTAR
jgi:hypothetical protein